jgi:hypothetical protein
MALKLIIRNTCKVPVAGTVPDENGTPQRFSFTLICRRLGADALAEALKLPMREFFDAVVNDWEGVSDDQGQPLPFGPGALGQLLDIHGMAPVALKAYLLESGAKEKN